MAYLHPDKVYGIQSVLTPPQPQTEVGSTLIQNLAHHIAAQQAISQSQVQQ